VKYPTTPVELSYARLLKIDGLLPWEFDAYPADDWFLAVSVLGNFEEARKDAKAHLRPEPDDAE
jgi:hypothetical protein